jgi:hypothetical protein
VLSDVIDWLSAVVRVTDSSLVDEWTALNGGTVVSAAELDAAEAAPHPLTGNPHAFEVMIRNAMFARVKLAAEDDVDALGALDAENWSADDWDEALGEYWDEHDQIGLSAQARGPQFFFLDKSAKPWRVRQIIDDPAGNHDWAIDAIVDPDASDEQERLVLKTTRFFRID